MKTIMIICIAPVEQLQPAIDEAVSLGYRIVFCGDKMYPFEVVPVERRYQIRWDDTERITEIARAEKVDGILAEVPACAPYAAMAARKLGLSCNSPEGLAALNNKSSFRSILKRAGVFCPAYYRAVEKEDLWNCCADMRLPLIVKPEECSSSRGMTVIQSKEDDLIRAYEYAAGYSANGKVCIEEFVTAENPLKAVEADIFVHQGEILWDGIRYSYRSKEAPLRPVCDVYPADLTQAELSEFKKTVTAVIREAGITEGEHDVEGFFTREGRFFILEINPRPAGYWNPQDIELYCGVNLTRLLVSTTVGDDSYWEELKHFQRSSNFILSYSLFSKEAGILDHVHIDPSLRLLALRFFPGMEKGAQVQDIYTAFKPVAKVILGFDNMEERDAAFEKIDSLVYTVVK